MKAKPRSLPFALPLLLGLLLAACNTGTIAYKGTCSQQSQQFLDYVYDLVTEELSPTISAGLYSGPTPDLMKSIDEFDRRVSALNTPECNPRTVAVKDALRDYLYEARSYFTVVAGRAVYGEGPVMAQRAKMHGAGLAFEIAFADVRR